MAKKEAFMFLQEKINSEMEKNIRAWSNWLDSRGNQIPSKNVNVKSCVMAEENPVSENVTEVCYEVEVEKTVDLPDGAKQIESRLAKVAATVTCEPCENGCGMRTTIKSAVIQ